MKLTTIGSYGNYKSSNYGAHSLIVMFEKLTLYYSYKTIVAFNTLFTGLVCRQNDWQKTTGKHLNVIQPDKKKRLPSEQFEAKLAEVLKQFGLAD